MKYIREEEIEKLIKTYNYKLLGEINVSDEYYAQLLENAKWKINHLYMQMVPKEDLVLSLFLVQVAIRQYKEGKFWKVFNEQLELEISAAKQNYLGQIFIRTIQKYNLYELSKEEANIQMYVENIKAHAFVTNYYMKGFFDFANAYYENNLFRQIPEDISGELEDLFAFMQTTLSSNKDAITDGRGSKRAAKSYKLLKSTRIIFAEHLPGKTRQIFEKILVLLDKYFYEGKIPSIVQDRFEQGFIDWIKDDKNSEIAQSVQKSERKLVSYRPHIQVDISNEIAYLVIPAQKFRAEECDGEAKVEITVNSCSEKRDLELYQSFGIYISEPMKIELSDIFSEIEIDITTLTSKIFYINKANYRIFDQKWENINKFSLGHNYILTKKNTVVTWKDEDDMIEYEDYRLWNEFSVNIEESSIFYVDGHPLSIIGEFSVDPIFDFVIEKFEIYKNGKKVIAARQHPTISFVVDNAKFGGTVIVINGKNYVLSDIRAKTCYSWPENKNKMAVTISLEKLLGYSEGYFNVFLNIPAEPNKLLCDYVILKKFDCRFNKRRFMYDTVAELTIVHKGIQLLNIPNEWAVIGNEPTFGVTYSIPISASLEKIEFDLELNERVTLLMPIRVFLYGFSQLEMKVAKEDYIWYADMKEIMYIKMPDATRVGVYWGKENDNVSEGEEISPGLFRIDISEFVRRIQGEYKKKYQYLNVIFFDNAKRNIALPPILRNILLTPYFDLKYMNGQVSMDIEIKGNAVPYLTVKNYNTEEIVVDHKEIHTGENEFPELTLEGYYDLYPVMEEIDEFGFETSVTELKPKRGVGCVDLENLVNCRLIISNLICDEDILGLDYEYFVFLTEKLDDRVYLGFMNCMRYENGKLNKETLKKFGRIKVFIYQLAEEIRASIQLYSYREEEWMDPYYDMDRNMILHCDNTLLDKDQGQNRFLLLDSEATEYVFDRNRLRRTR